MRLAIASDHAGFELKEDLRQFIEELGVEVEDHGPSSEESVDYPDFASRVAGAVAGEQVDAGVLVCGSGIGMSIAANKFPGVRAALVTSVHAAEMCRRHNDANVLCFSGWATGKPMAREMFRRWHDATFDGGRHERRVGKIHDLEPGPEDA